MSMAVEYIDFGFASAVSESEQLYYDTDLVRWATGSIYNEYTKNSIIETTTLNLNVKNKGNSFVANMYIIPESSMSIITTYEDAPDIKGFYSELATASEGSCLEKLSGNWIGTHSYIDSVLSKSYAGYSADSYACSYIRPMTTKRACIVVDYSSDAIADILQDLDLGKGSISGFITADGRELVLNNDEVVKDSKFSFGEQEFFVNAMADDAATVIEYVTYNFKSYLSITSKSYNNGSAICAMIPVSSVNAGARSIGFVTFLMVLVALAIVVFICIIIIAGTGSTIGQIGKKLQAVSGGDLTVTMDTDRNDEFKGLVKNIAEMITNSRNLIVKVNSTTENVSTSTSHIVEVSDVLSKSSNQIAVAVDEMDIGVTQQSSDTQNCLTLMDELSKKITVAGDTIRQMNTITGETKNIIADGVSIMDDLASKSEDTSNITRSVTENIKKLGDSLQEIEKFVGVINGVAEETSLLALNASIEAARAGEAGKGFAVVAQSVSKLSDSTIEAADQIQEVISLVRGYADDTVEVATQAETIVSKQTDTVKDTVSVFGKINEHMETLVDDIVSVEESVLSMEKHRNDTLAAIESISSVSEQTAASVSVVNDSIKAQMTMVENLQNSTIELKERAKELTEAVNAFKI
jgi:methyl-accepting chemotaxis protein